MSFFYYQSRRMIKGFFCAVCFCIVSHSALSQQLSSINGENKISLQINDKGEVFYTVWHQEQVVIQESPMGLKSDDQDFTRNLSVVDVSPVTKRREQYQLKVGNTASIDHTLNSRSITFINNSGGLLVIDLVAGKEGVAFRYRFPEESDRLRTIEEEVTGFRIEKEASAWLQPYNKAGQYTPAYEDFYFNVGIGETIQNPRNPSSGFCMPALFNTNKGKTWVLVAESGTDGSYCGCHLGMANKEGLYKIQFAKKDEKYTLPIDKNSTPNPKFTLPWTMPWRVMIIGDDAGEIMLSTLITDIAPASKIEDDSWIEAGKASWSWWSHTDDKSAEVFNEFTNLAESFDWQYTLFDAGWEEANAKEDIVGTAIEQGVQPLVWGYSGNYFHEKERKEKLKRLADLGVKGIKIDFWCSDRQEAMSAIHSLFEDAAKEELLVNLHGSPMPRGWHRTWPNFVSAESVLGTESYFYDQRFPEKAAEQNTILPFTRNVAGPTDYTPIALTMRKFPRKNSAVHELATSMVYTSGIIHFADSKEIFESLPNEVQELLEGMPATWDRTESIIAKPGEAIVLYRERKSASYIVGINGTDRRMPINIDLKKYGKGFSKFRVISEGEDPLMDFKLMTYPITSQWSHTMLPKGGFIIQFVN